jgi:hypothetical protein
MQQRLPLTTAAGQISRLAVSLDLRKMTANCIPTFDLPALAHSFFSPSLPPSVVGTPICAETVSAKPLGEKNLAEA